MVASLLLALALTFSHQASAAEQSCYSGDAGGRRFNWCVSIPADPRPGAILYYLHGNGGNEQVWSTPVHDQLEKAIEGRGKKIPVVVTISFGPTWFLSEHSWLNAFVAATQKTERALNLSVKERWLMGESMGGFNSLLVYFKRPGLFSRVVSFCPAVLNFSPYGSWEELEAYLGRHQPYVVRKLVEKWRDKMRSEYPSPAAWVAHDPRVLPKPAKDPYLFLGADGRDAFGFQEAAEVVAKNLRRQRANVEWRFNATGGHCDYDQSTLGALADFLAR